MTPSQILSSVEKQQLQLNGRQRFNHYSTAHFALFVGLGLPMMILGGWLIDARIDFALSKYEVALFSIPSLIVAALLYRHFARILALSKVNTPLGVSDIRELLIGLAEREGWQVQRNRKSFIVLKTHPGFTRNCGERITVLFHGGEVWVNSICDPDSDPAFYSSGRNRRNRQLIHAYSSGNRQLSR